MNGQAATKPACGADPNPGDGWSAGATPSSASSRRPASLSSELRGTSRRNGSTGSRRTEAMCAYSEAILRGSPPRSTKCVIKMREPSREPRPIRTGAPVKKARSPLRRSPWASRTASNRRLRRSSAKSATALAKALHRPCSSIRLHFARSRTITSSKWGLWRTTSAVRSSAAQAMRALGKRRRRARASGEANTKSPRADSRTTRMARACRGIMERVGESWIEGYHLPRPS